MFGPIFMQLTGRASAATVTALRKESTPHSTTLLGSCRRALQNQVKLLDGDDVEVPIGVGESVAVRSSPTATGSSPTSLPKHSGVGGCTRATSPGKTTRATSTSSTARRT
jgi:hypothetical protein